MKFLNEIDGADKVKQDSDNRFVTDTQINLWDSKWDFNEDIIKAVKVNSATNADTVNGKTVAVNVPSGAKFTDTTYSEITTAEIDAGTASTLKVVTGRRIKYILDKVSSMISVAIGALTKSSVGLGNVDNTSDANKPISTATQSALNGKVNNSQVLTNVPSGAKFTDTIYTHPSNHPASMITESATKRFVSDTDKVKWDSKQEALGYTPVNKAGDNITGQLGVESTTFPVIDIARNTSGTGGNLYGGARLQRKTTNPTNGVGIGFYFQAPNSNKAMTHAGMFGGALGTIQAGSEKGEIVVSPSYAGQDPYTRRDLVIRAISASKAEAELNGKLTTDNTVYSDTSNTVTTKKYVDDGLNDKVDNSKVLTNVPANAVFTDTKYSAITQAEAENASSTTARLITGQRLKQSIDKHSVAYIKSNIAPSDTSKLWLDTSG